MKIILFNVWNDFKRNKFFKILLMVEILVVIFIMGIMIGKTDNIKTFVGNFEKKNSEVVMVQLPFWNGFGEYIGKEGFQDCAFTDNKTFDDGTARIINKKAADMFKVPYSGKWFKENGSGEYAEALVSKELKSKFKVGESYTISGYSAKDYKIKVIGYLGKDNLTLDFGMSGYNNFFTNSSFLICDDDAIDLDDVEGVASVEKDVQFYIDVYNLEAETLGDSYASYKSHSFSFNYYLSYIAFVVFCMATVCILCNSIFNTERDIKRNMLKYVVGNSNRNIVVSEVLKCSFMYVLPFLFNFSITLIINLATRKEEIPIVTWSNFWASAGIVLAVYVLSTIFSLIRVIKAKPLKELKRN